MLTIAEDNLSVYKSFNFLGSLFAGSILFHNIAKMIFNIASPLKLVADLWSVIDFLSSVINLICFNYISNVPIEVLISYE